MTEKNKSKNKSNKLRLDLLLLKLGLAESRQRSRALILAGKVLVDNKPVDKPGTQIQNCSKIKVKGDDNPYVSRGGLKLAGALEGFKLDVNNLICMDIGASTGGFTDCLLQHGAEHVFAVDVGYGQLAWKLRNDARVTVIERTNIRYMQQDKIPGLVDLITIDASFISLKIVVPAAIKFLKPEAEIIALIKPQFEVGKNKVGKGGVVRDPELHEKVINDLVSFLKESGFIVKNVLPSPVKGPKGNVEFFIMFELNN